jgi:hypothetical protein
MVTEGASDELRLRRYLPGTGIAIAAGLSAMTMQQRDFKDCMES